jgi:flagellum-specific ATP synthase
MPSGDHWMAASPSRRDPKPYWLKAPPVEAHRRRDLGPRLDLGVRALNLFTPCREGQRMGIFAGSGVGKSTLLAMLARHSDADALVLGLIGERGRELPAFSIRGSDPRASLERWWWSRPRICPPWCGGAPRMSRSP